jgi:hypothetical protein
MDAYELAGTDDAGDAQASDPLTAHQMAAIDPDMLESMGESLAKRRDAWVTARGASGVERRWLEDIDQYNGRDDATKAAASMMDAVERGFPVTNQAARPQRSTVFVNITRPKTNAAEARLANMLCPTDDRNWGLKPTPDPKLVQAAMAQAKAKALTAQTAVPAGGAPQPQPVPVPAGQAAPASSPGAGLSPYPSHDAQGQLAEAARCAKAMQDEMDDQLIECDYLGQLRLMMHDCAVLGAGVVKGPIVVNRVRKAWQPMMDAGDASAADGAQTCSSGVYALEIVEETKPASERVDPWNVYPDPSCGEDIHTGRGVFEKKTYTSKQLRELAKQPGYLREQISKVLEEGPQSALSTSRDTRNRADSGGNEADKDHYEMWEYWGEFSPADLSAAGVEVPEGSTDAISGCVMIVNKTVIKGYLNPMETGDLPYDVMVWEKVDGSCWGYGMPYLIRPAQRVLNAAWRQLMDNSGLSVGPNVVIDPTVIQPADGRWELTGRKIWNKIDATVSAKDAFASFDFPSNGQDIQEIIRLAMEFADQESSMPQLAQGEQGTAPDTVGGMTLLMNSSNVVLGRMVKQFDDNVTRPHIRRYYDWNMAYNDKAELKGDFQVDARGSSALLVRDMMHQTMLSLGQYQASGIISPMVNWEAWFKEILQMAHMDPTDIMKTEAEIAQLQTQPPSATPEQIRAQALLQVAQIRAQSAQSVAQSKQQGEIAFAQTEAQIAQQNASAALQELQMKRDLALLQYAHENKMSLQQVQADLAKTAMQERTKRELAAAELQMRADENDRARAHETLMAPQRIG